jgi:hypothetical protein
MSFTGNENHHIGLQDAAKLTANYRQTSEKDALLASYFSKSALQKVLDQPNCIGIRIYYALSNDGKQEFVISGVNSEENDLYNGELLEYGVGCPPNCSISNPLNS